MSSTTNSTSWQSTCRSTFAGNSALLPSDIIDFSMLPAQRFWRETVSSLDVMSDLKVTNESMRCWLENFQVYNKREMCYSW